MKGIKHSEKPGAVPRSGAAPLFCHKLHTDTKRERIRPPAYAPPK